MGKTPGRRSDSTPALEFRWLEVFVAVVEAESMTGAATGLGLSQSAVSQAIKQLEGALGVVLIDRTVRPSAMTEAGNDLYLRACRILSEVGETAHAVRRAAQVGPVSLRIGLVDSFAATVGPPLAHQLREYGSSCQLLSGQSSMHAQALRKRELDLVVTSDDTLISEPGLAVDSLLAEPIIMALPADYPRETSSIEDVSRHLELVRYSERAAIGRQIMLHLHRLRIVPRSTLAFDSSEAVLAMVGYGLGFALTTPLCVVQAPGRLHRLRLVPVPGPKITRHLAIGRHQGELQELAEQIRAISLESLRRDAIPRIAELGEWMLPQLGPAEGDNRSG